MLIFKIFIIWIKVFLIQTLKRYPIWSWVWICVFYTGMKKHNSLKNASLYFMIINLRKALKENQNHTKPHALKALIRNWSLSQDCLFCLDPLYLLPELRWAMAPAKLFSASYVCMPCHTCVLAMCCSPPVCASFHLPCSACVHHDLNALELVQASTQPVNVLGTARSDLKHLKETFQI